MNIMRRLRSRWRLKSFFKLGLQRSLLLKSIDKFERRGSTCIGDEFISATTRRRLLGISTVTLTSVAASTAANAGNLLFSSIPQPICVAKNKSIDSIILSETDGTITWKDKSGIQREVSIGDLKTPASFGAKGDGITDDTAAIAAFWASGEGYVKPAKAFYKVSKTTNIPSGASFFGPPTAIIRLVLPPGSAVVPMITTDRSSTGNVGNITLLGGFTFDQNGFFVQEP